MRPPLLVNDLSALGSLLASLVFFTGLVYSGKFYDSGRPASWPPVITWLWRAAWVLWLVAVVTFVIVRIQYPVDGDITISPPHAPLMQQILQLLGLGSIIGGHMFLWAWWLAIAIRGARARSRNRQRRDTAMRQPLLQGTGGVAIAILAPILVVVVGATCPFVLIAIVLLLGHPMPH